MTAQNLKDILRATGPRIWLAIICFVIALTQITGCFSFVFLVAGILLLAKEIWIRLVGE